MNMADMNNRWIYKGSVTTPPCKTNVYWNVLTTIYPVKQRHLDQFKNQLKRGHLEKTGNYRVINKLTPQHNPMIITTEAESTTGMMLIGIVIAIAAICLLIVLLRVLKETLSIS